MSYKTTSRRLVCLILLVLTAPVSMNAATALYKAPQTYPLFQGSLSSIAAADLNGDGKVDLLVTVRGGGFPGSVQVLLGNGDGTFQVAGNYPVGSDANWIVVADVNGDGKLDAVVATLNGASVLLGNGDGTFQSPRNYSIPSLLGALSIAVGEVNKDGKLDIVVSFDDCNHNEGGSMVLFGNGDGTFEPTGTCIFSGGQSIALADLNRDGKLDLVSDTQEDRGNVAIELGNGDGTFQAAQFYDSDGFNGGTITVADLNGDGIPDVIAANNCGENNCRSSTVGVLLGVGDGTLRRRIAYSRPGGYDTNQVAVTDVNGDGLPDLVVANDCNNNTNCDTGEVGLLLGKGDGTFSRSQSFSSGGSIGVGSTSVAVGDANGDGTPDIFVINSDGVGVLLSVSTTATRLSSNPNPSVEGQPVVLTATVTSSGQTAPTGRVVFKNGKTVFGSAQLIGGVASVTKAHLPVGTLSLSATYKGDTNSLPSTSAVVIQVVNITKDRR